MKSKTKLLIVLLAFLSTTWITYGHDQVPAPPQDKPILLVNGTIHTVTGATLDQGQLLFENGKITAVRQSIEPPSNCEVIDVSGKHVYPGLISAISSIGLVEINSVNATIDIGELTPFNPNLKAQVAVNPDSEIIPVTRANGVLTAHVTPSTYQGGFIAGKTAVINLDGWTTEDLTLRAPTGMAVSWPRDPRLSGFHPEDPGNDNPAKAEEAYTKKIDELSDFLEEARAFEKAKAKGKSPLNVDLRLEAMIPVLNRELPVHIFANTARQIRDAVRWAESQELRMVLMDGTDAWRVATLLQEKGIPVVIGGVNQLPSRRWESYDVRFTNAAKLHTAGVQFAIAYAGGGPVSSNERNLPYEAGKAVAHGLAPEEALKAITIYPAEILGVADRLGSLEIGKDATLIVTTGNPLDIRSNVKLAFIQGRPVDLSSRHTQLYEKYQQRYLQQ